MEMYLVLSAVVVGLNVMPAFMPPTWMVLAFFTLFFKLQLPIVVLIGASCATAGRLILAYASRSLLGERLKGNVFKNLASLRQFMDTHEHLTVPMMLFYGFLPFPSNHVFIFLGASKVRLKPFVISFFFARLVSYTFWILTTHRVIGDIARVIAHHYQNPKNILFEALGFAFLIILFIVPWREVLGRFRKHP